MDKNQKAAIVTGASSGIGKAISYKLASSGYMLALVARTGEKLDIVKKDIEQLGGNAIGIPADLTRNSEVEDNG